MKVDDEKIYTYRISVGVWFCHPRCGLASWMHWSCILMRLYQGLSQQRNCILLPRWELTVRTLANCPRRRICMDNPHYFQITQPGCSRRNIRIRVNYGSPTSIDFGGRGIQKFIFADDRSFQNLSAKRKKILYMKEASFSVLT